MRLVKGLFLILIISCVAVHAKAAVGCKVMGGSEIYSSYTFYVLGVKLSNGVTIGIAQDIYHANSPVLTTVSCTIPWANNIVSSGPNTCIYGNPTGIPVVVGSCNDCVYGELVNYTTTLECDLDDYSWFFGASVTTVGMLIIRRRRN